MDIVTEEEFEAAVARVYAAWVKVHGTLSDRFASANVDRQEEITDG